MLHADTLSGLAAEAGANVAGIDVAVVAVHAVLSLGDAPSGKVLNKTS